MFVKGEFFMRKAIALMLAAMLTFSLVTMPASAKDAMVGGAPFKIVDIDNWDASVNYLTDSTKLKDTNISLGYSSGNVSLYSSSSKNCSLSSPNTCSASSGKSVYS